MSDNVPRSFQYPPGHPLREFIGRQYCPNCHHELGDPFICEGTTPNRGKPCQKCKNFSNCKTIYVHHNYIKPSVNNGALEPTPQANHQASATPPTHVNNGSHPGTIAPSPSATTFNTPTPRVFLQVPCSCGKAGNANCSHKLCLQCCVRFRDETISKGQPWATCHARNHANKASSPNDVTRAHPASQLTPVVNMSGGQIAREPELSETIHAVTRPNFLQSSNLPSPSPLQVRAPTLPDPSSGKSLAVPVAESWQSQKSAAELNRKAYEDQNTKKKNMLAALRREYIIVFYTEDGGEPLRFGVKIFATEAVSLVSVATENPDMDILGLMGLPSEGSGSKSSMVLTWDGGDWVYHTVNTTRRVTPDSNRLLYRSLRSNVRDCNGLDDEIQKISVPGIIEYNARGSSTVRRLRDAPVSPIKNLHSLTNTRDLSASNPPLSPFQNQITAVNQTINDHSVGTSEFQHFATPASQPASSTITGIITPSPGGPSLSPSPRNSSGRAGSPPASQSTMSLSQVPTLVTSSVVSPPVKTIQFLPTNDNGYHAKWPSEYSVQVISDGIQHLKMICSRIYNKQHGTQNKLESAFPVVFPRSGTFASSTYHQKRRLLEQAPDGLKSRYISFGNTPRGSWQNFERELRGDLIPDAKAASRNASEDIEVHPSEFQSPSPPAIPPSNSPISESASPSEFTESCEGAIHLQPTPALASPLNEVPTSHLAGAGLRKAENQDDSVSQINELDNGDFGTRIENHVGDGDEAPEPLVCPHCSEFLPVNPSAKLNGLLRRAVQLQRDFDNGYIDISALSISVNETCCLHKFETSILPHADPRWPRTIEFHELPRRVIDMRESIDALLEDSESSSFFQEAQQHLERSNTKRQRRTAASDFTMESSLCSGAGYYGMAGKIIIESLLRILYPPKKIDPDMVQPMTYDEFLRHVLVPETAVMLIAEDQSTSYDGALTILVDSSEYGKTQFPEEIADSVLKDITSRYAAPRDESPHPIFAPTTPTPELSTSTVCRSKNTSPTPATDPNNGTGAVTTTHSLHDNAPGSGAAPHNDPFLTSGTVYSPLDELPSIPNTPLRSVSSTGDEFDFLSYIRYPSNSPSKSPFSFP